MYPQIEPYDQGLLPVGDGHAIYWECSGDPSGTPALYLHGGPGSGSTPGARRYFDPQAYRVALLDQRGCGRSRPLLTERSQLEVNTTAHLLRDIELLRGHLGIERWVVLGLSWGCTLALAYAQAHPGCVTALVLAGVTTTSRREVDWLVRGVGRIFPEQWERFAGHIPPELASLPIVEAYAELLFETDPAVCAAAALQWCAWEDAHVSLAPGHAPNPRFRDPDFRLRFARIVTHYWQHAAFLEENRLIDNAGALGAIPGFLIHGRYDVSSPLETAWLLHRRWRGSRLIVVETAGHAGGGMPECIQTALDELR